MMKNSLGCGKRFKIINGKMMETKGDKCDFVCGVANAWGQESLCDSCKFKLEVKWLIEGRLKE